VPRDKTEVLEAADFVGCHSGEDEQREAPRGKVVWFWHALSHFVMAWLVVVGVR
jgi:hypothetical protein